MIQTGIYNDFNDTAMESMSVLKNTHCATMLICSDVLEQISSSFFS